ncbi:pyridoxamine 5'-phosphate oxidase family protein [Alteromonas sp. ASW11-36]|uniref:Pyridoxamine 5'-phosphate oxidase family protein n=1 Tax=Alteromonas arenosi TaxID=3055817 RepID=A0ABT7ST78_9ALTE|nr:pyridoxamine 5'-phosphate oxidase family protein [Alteromonas sp. ASW11-36]MDM7859189.1 pyridoxamine 5'-phosphate oxidase family protein [Alteromonas sp. ASW11-36]
MYDTPFHEAERRIQRKLGIEERVYKQVRKFIRPHMPEQHQTFYASLPFVLLSVLDNQGHPWLTPAFGKPGFVTVPDEASLQINGKPLLADAIDLELSAGHKVGMLGIELPSRRRNRVNGTIHEQGDKQIHITVDQSFGNCPKYIQQRTVKLSTSPKQARVEQRPSLSENIEGFIANADTFFIASRVKELSSDPRAGLDASHRGGNPGFVKVETDKNVTRLRFPDFSGNKFFNTIGNIISDPRVGLFFPDFDNGHGYFIQGRANVVWDEEVLAEYPGAERFVEVEVERVVAMYDAMPIETKLEQTSPFLVGTGDWQDLAAKLLPENTFHALFLAGYDYAKSTID